MVPRPKHASQVATALPLFSLSIWLEARAMQELGRADSPMAVTTLTTMDRTKKAVLLLT